MIDLKQNIRRRKMIDAAFAVAGVMLISGALTILAILIGRLVRDGAGRLVQTQEVKADGGVPSKREVLGALRYGPDGAIEIVPDTIELIAPVGSAVNLEPLAGKRIAVNGSTPRAGENIIEVEAATLLDNGKQPGRRESAGILKRVTRGRAVTWTLLPDPLRLEVPDLKPDLSSSLVGERVAILGTRPRGTHTLDVQEISTLVPQGFFTSMSSGNPYRAGIFPAWVGTILVMIVTMCTALPLGVGAGIYLEEYASKNWFTAMIEINIANLAGVPSIIWGLMALAIFVYQFNLGHSIASAGLTLGLLVLPIVIISTREAIRAVPAAIRDASVALGATKWETVRHHVLPYSLSGILTGTIVGLSRAVGETAPLIAVGAVVSINYLPDSPFTGKLFGWLWSDYTVLPIQMFHWTSSPYPGFNENAAAAGIVLIVLTLSMNAVAIVLRYRLRKRVQW